ncbi:electron transport complex RsxE subunit [Methylophilales bacterium MBRSG12]|uniref:Ion-translocating oxidoreductase complex subunit E n=1 Tax=Methylophilales bacterium MBRS-H7 TaxID=1623450 RepID=A0A0H4JC27_9PROT|nr:electron transport complex RsxE subunit [Methylophilales bacterium MBRSF5]AKO66047.1 electron transport complex RsxE subunit [Methylophilales bacterium MBRS-H7]AKO67365.1 electron transport complex RsxE subunit [Methylophilales bacterium MBRSG12]
MIREQLQDGLWKQNAGLVQLLGLCPTLAVTVNITNGVALGVATIFVMMLSNISISPIRNYVPESARVPIFILVIAGLVTIVDLSINALSKPLYDALGIFIPLIVTNCIVLARVEAFASKNSTLPSLYDGFFMGLGLTFVLIILGAVREIVGNGTLFQNLHFLIGDKYEFLTIQLFDSSDGFLLAALPPGAFIALSALILFLNLVNQNR